MTTKLVVLVLALSWVIQATHSLAIEEQLFNEHHLFDDLNLEDGPVGNVALTKFTFDYTEEDKVYLIVCTNAEYTSGTGPGTPALIYTYPTDTLQEDLLGEFTDDNTTCAKFDITGNLPYPQTSTTYVLVIPILTISENSEERQEVSKTGSASFIYSVEGSVMACSPKNLTRITWSDDEANFANCLNDEWKVTKVCYLEEDKTETEVCFTTDQEPASEICRNGGLTTVEDGTFAVNYLAYDESSVQLSITSDDDQPVENYELTVWSSAENSNAAVTNCTKDPCDVSPTFTPGDLKYDMCVVARSDSTVQSSYTSIQDVNLQVYDIYNDKSFIEFGFLNLNAESKAYTASLFNSPSNAAPQSPVSTVSIDCSGVDETSYCYGFILTVNTSVLTDEIYVAVEYFDSNNEVGNRVASLVLDNTDTLDVAAP